MEIIIDASKTFLFALGKEAGLREVEERRKEERREEAREVARILGAAARVLYYKGGWPISQIAEELNVSVAEVEAALTENIKP